MTLNATVDTVNRRLKLQEVSAFAAGDIYNPIVFDFDIDDPTLISTETLVFTLSRTDVTPVVNVASAMTFQTVDGHPRKRRALLSLATTQLADWFLAAPTAIQNVRCSLSDSASGGRVYALCDVPIILRSMNASGSANPYYTTQQVDSMLAQKQNTLTGSAPVSVANNTVSVATAAKDTLGVVKTTVDTPVSLADYLPCPISNGVPFFRKYDNVDTHAGLNVFGLVKTTSPTTDVTNFLACPIVDGVPYYQDTGSTYSPGGYSSPGLVTTTSTVSDVSNYLPCPVINGVPYYQDTGSTYGLGGYNSQGLVTTDVNPSSLIGFVSCPISNGVPKYKDTTYSAATSNLGLVKTTSPVTDATGYIACPIIDGVVYYSNTDTVYGLSNGNTTAGLIRTSSTVTNTSGFTACPVVNGVPYYKDTLPDTVTPASYNSLGVVKTNVQSTDVTGFLGCRISNGFIYYHDTTYGEASSSLGLVKTTSGVSDVSGYIPCPIVGGVPYYQNTITSYGAATSNLGLVRTTSNIASTAGYIPCPIIDGVPYYQNTDTNTTYSSATTSALGLVRCGSGVTDVTGYTACPIVDGVPYYHDTTTALASGLTPGLVKTTSPVTDASGYSPCPIIGGVPYYAVAAVIADLSYQMASVSSATMVDRTMNRLTLMDASNVAISFPSANPGRARDFTLLVTIPPGSASVGNLTWPSGIYFFWGEGEAPFSNDLERSTTDTVYYQFFFTEIDASTFRVSRVKLVNT